MNDLHPEVRELSARERNWIARLEKTLRACPTERLELVTIGDSDLTVIDGRISRKYDMDLHDGAARRNGVVLGAVLGKPLIHGVSG